MMMPPTTVDIRFNFDRLTLLHPKKMGTCYGPATTIMHDDSMKEGTMALTKYTLILSNSNPKGESFCSNYGDIQIVESLSYSNF